MKTDFWLWEERTICSSAMTHPHTGLHRVLIEATCKSAEVDSRIWMEYVLGKIPANLFQIDTISSESTTNSTDSELIYKICNVLTECLHFYSYNTIHN